MKYRIAGAGPSGLAAALTLRHAGAEVDVYEHRRDCGLRFGGDLQGLENWSDDLDVCDELRGYGITVDFHCAPVTRGVQTNGRREDVLSFARPALYLVKRGGADDALDQALKRQALEAGVRLHFDTTLEPDQAHIVATGPKGRSVFAVDRGVVFDTDSPDRVVVMLDDELAPRGYAYLLVSGGYGCICTMLFEDFSSVHERLRRTQDAFVGRFGFRIENPRRVGGIGSFAVDGCLRDHDALVVGEAAGLQDLQWGFGIRTAIRSGVLAARCLLTGGDWERAARRRFRDRLRGSVVNRFLWEMLRHGRYRALMAAFRWGGPYALMRAFAGFNPVQRALYPLARVYVRRQQDGVV